MTSESLPWNSAKQDFSAVAVLKLIVYSCFHISFNCVFSAAIALYYLRSSNPWLYGTFSFNITIWYNTFIHTKWYTFLQWFEHWNKPFLYLLLDFILITQCFGMEFLYHKYMCVDSMQTNTSVPVASPLRLRSEAFEVKHHIAFWSSLIWEVDFWKMVS